MKKYSKILILALMGFTGTAAIASEPPIEATAAAEAQQVALEYAKKQADTPESSDE
jgi:hypothetical protein